MVIYVDPKLIGRRRYESLKEIYPQIDFVTDVERKSEIQVMFTMPQIVKEMNLDDYPKLKWIQYLMAGFDGLDLTKFTDRKIIFSNAQDIFSKSIAEDVFTKILYFNRNVRYYIEQMKLGSWQPIREEPELTGSQVLILGVGSIGKELAKRFKAFEMEVVGYRNRNLAEDNFDEIITSEKELLNAIPKADYIVLALPLNDQTFQMFDKEKFSLMKKSALFINVARGKVVNQDDLIDALVNQKIRGAGLDVLDPGPLPQDHQLWNLDNVYITPHNASSSPYMRERLYQMILMNLNLYLNDNPIKYQLN